MNRSETRRAAFAGALVATLVGCNATQKGGETPEEPADREIHRAVAHEYPPISLDSSGREHVIVLQGPNPGWRLDLDAVQATRDGTVVYATLRQPDPERMYPQVITERRLGTTVPSTEPVELAVRILEHGDASDAAPYHSAARVD
jgi:hypothetical protein